MAEPENQPPADANAEADALESPPESDVNALDSSSSVTDTTADATGGGGAPPPQKSGGIKALLRRFNIYLLFFVFILVIAGIIVGIAYFQSKKAATTSTLKTQNLTQSTLEQVANSDATVGSSQEVLNVQSSAVFAGKVLVREDLEVAGSLQIGGTVALTNLAVSGSTQLGQTSISKDLSVTGDTAIQGSLSLSKSLQVNGGGTFSGAISAPQVTTTNLQLNGDLVLTHHISAGGGTPSRSNGSALGSGGSSSVSGSDTAGTVSINTGSSPAAGCFATISFTSKYNATPHVLLTPVGSNAGGLAYYVTRTTSDFSICDATAPPAGSSFSFDYFVVD